MGDGAVTGTAALTAAGAAELATWRTAPDATFGDDAWDVAGLDTGGCETGVGRAVPGLFE